MCGGTTTPAFDGAILAGLSPRVRGNPAPLAPLAARRGSIPACAGEPGVLRCPMAATRVYPRVCGGTSGSGSGSGSGGGLSPRVRGNLAVDLARQHDGRSIPACAGEPVVEPYPVVLGGVYPRVCGGTTGGRVARRMMQGLSPRVRGNRNRMRSSVRLAGSIPACAGEPPCPRMCRRRSPVYPRVCGGTARRRARVAADGGLSPRVRGNHGLTVQQQSAKRSIPACAGEPWSGVGRSSISWVYPRVCGGTTASRKR